MLQNSLPSPSENFITFTQVSLYYLSLCLCKLAALSTDSCDMSPPSKRNLNPARGQQVAQ